MLRVEKGLYRCAKLSAWLCGFLIVIQSVWISYAVFLRYFLHQGDMYMLEVTSLLLLLVAFLGAPFALREEAFPTVFMVVNRFPIRVQKWLRAIALVMCIIFFGLFTRGAAWIAIDAYKTDYVTTVVHWPYSPFWAVITFSGVLFMLVALVLLINTLRELFPGSGHDLTAKSSRS